MNALLKIRRWLCSPLVWYAAGLGDAVIIYSIYRHLVQ